MLIVIIASVRAIVTNIFLLTEKDIFMKGLCKCGCGMKTRIPERNHSRYNEIKGVPRDYIRGHNIKNPNGTYLKSMRYEVDSNGCWVWKMNICSTGYGQVKVNGKNVLAHRYYYSCYNYDELKEDMQIDHLCRVPACVNPSHLQQVTPAVNVRRGNVAKLDEKKVKNIKKLLSNHFSVSKIASIYHVNYVTIYNIKESDTWKDVL